MGNGCCGAPVRYLMGMNCGTACTSFVNIDETFSILLIFRLLDRMREDIAVGVLFVYDS